MGNTSKPFQTASYDVVARLARLRLLIAQATDLLDAGDPRGARQVLSFVDAEPGLPGGPMRIPDTGPQHHGRIPGVPAR